MKTAVRNGRPQPGLPPVPLLFLTPDRIVAQEDASKLASSVTIHRDEWGVPHIYGPTDASTSFGLAYVQAEDYFWQVEDTYLQALGAMPRSSARAGLARIVLMRHVRGARPLQSRLRNSSIRI